jgi:integrase
MADAAMNLSAKKVAKLISKGVPANHYDGKGLRLEIRGKNAASWTTRYQIDGVTKYMGLGSASAFTLAEARERNRKLVRQKLADKIDPLALRNAERSAQAAAARKTITFAEAAKAFLAGNASGWRNAKHVAQWQSTLATYIEPIIGSLSVADIDVTHVLKVLEQHVPAKLGYPAGTFWTVRPETASRVRGRIEAVLDWATARQHRAGDNPASWRTLGKVLPAPGKIAKVVHHAALPYAELPAFMAALRAREGIAAQALAFTILTAARTNEALGAKWDEIDLHRKTWTVPAGRMKAGEAHVVPLAKAALDLLEALPRERGNEYLFVGRGTGTRLAETAMISVLARMRRTDVTIHGFRSTFRDWSAEQTAFPHDVCEMALAHTVGDASTRAYKRSKLLPKRRQLTDAWARYCVAQPVATTSDNIVSIGGGR